MYVSARSKGRQKDWTLWELNPRPFTISSSRCEAKIIPLDQAPLPLLVVDEDNLESILYIARNCLVIGSLAFCHCIIISPAVKVGHSHLATERCGATQVVRYLAAIKACCTRAAIPHSSTSSRLSKPAKTQIYLALCISNGARISNNRIHSWLQAYIHTVPAQITDQLGEYLSFQIIKYNSCIFATD